MTNTLFCPVILQITLTEATVIKTDISDKTRRRVKPGRPSPDTAAPDRKHCRAPCGVPHAAGRACRSAARQPPVTAHSFPPTPLRLQTDLMVLLQAPFRPLQGTEHHPGSLGTPMSLLENTNKPAGPAPCSQLPVIPPPLPCV